MSIRVIWQLGTICLLACQQQVAGQANTSLSNLANPTSISQSLIPSATGTLTLGNATKSWSRLYVSQTLYYDNVRSMSGSIANNNFFIGPNAGNLAPTGTTNLGVGVMSLWKVTSGSSNTGLGFESGKNLTTGVSNTLIGHQAGLNVTFSQENTLIGASAGKTLSGGGANTVIGSMALSSLSNYNWNSVIGVGACEKLTAGAYNAILGGHVMNKVIIGHSNSIVGMSAFSQGTYGSYNAMLGYEAGQIYGGNNNTYVGAKAGQSARGSNNTLVGFETSVQDSVVNSTALGAKAKVTGSNQVRLGNLQTFSIGGFRAWSNYSDGRFKQDVKENVPGLEFINRLRPVTYGWKISELNRYLSRVEGNDNNKAALQPASTGFIAQEVEAAAKELKFDFDGVEAPQNDKDLYSIRYAEFVVPLVKAVQELSKKVDEKDSLISVLFNEIEALKLKSGSGRLREQKGMIAQNFPNPARVNTSVEYRLAEGTGNAFLTISDASGKMISREKISNMPMGKVNLNLSTFAAGIYQYSLIVDGKVVQTKKLSVVR